MLGLYKKWKAKKEQEIVDKIRKEMMNSSPRFKVSNPEIIPVNVKVFSLDKAEGMQYVNGNPYMRDTMNEHLAKKLGRQLLESGLVDVEYEQCIDESLCIKAKVEVIKR